VKEKQQTPAQRLANPVWLRAQIKDLIHNCDMHIKEDLKLAAQTYDDVSAQYRASVVSHRHWKRQLERVLRGETLTEKLIQSWEKLTSKEGQP
jgi:hypothetical protein